MKVSLVVTVLNEQESIIVLLDSIVGQSQLPDEVIVVDGGSTDKTVSCIKDYVLRINNKKKFKDHTFKIIEKKGNRAVGRNEGIKRAESEIIALTDAGCFLDKNWLKNITNPFNSKNVEVVAGYYRGFPKTVFQKCLVPYVLVMDDKLNPQTFLPASRTMAFRKSLWKELKGFPQQYSYNEDYVFAKMFREKNIKITFKKDAIVYWMPRKNLIEAFTMFYKFAFGDVEAGIFRPKVVFIFIRYALAIALVLMTVFFRSYLLLNTLYLILFLYVCWAVVKNYKYVKDIRAIGILPVIQLTADAAVLSGSFLGSGKLWVIHSKQ